MNNRLAIIMFALAVGSCAQAMVYLDESETPINDTYEVVASRKSEEERPVRKPISAYDNVSNCSKEHDQEEQEIECS